MKARASATEASPNKYKNKKCIGARGLTYDSIKEAARSHELEAQQRAGELTWQPQVRFRFEVNGIKLRHYLQVDFLITYPDGSQAAEDVKGYINKRDPYWRLYALKVDLLKACYPDIGFIGER